jgi:hypothetical protein
MEPIVQKEKAPPNPSADGHSKALRADDKNLRNEARMLLKTKKSEK